MIGPLVALDRTAGRVELAHHGEAGDGVHRDRELAVELGVATELAGNLAGELADVGVDPLLDGNQPLAQLGVLGGSDPELHRNGEQRAREVLPEQVEQGDPPYGGIVRELGGTLAIAVDPLLGEVRERARDEFDTTREMVALRPLRNAGELGHMPDRGAGVADRDQAPDGGVEQPGPGFGATLGLGPASWRRGGLVTGLHDPVLRRSRRGRP